MHLGESSSDLLTCHAKYTAFFRTFSLPPFTPMKFARYVLFRIQACVLGSTVVRMSDAGDQTSETSRGARFSTAVYDNLLFRYRINDLDDVNSTHIRQATEEAAEIVERYDIQIQALRNELAKLSDEREIAVWKKETFAERLFLPFGDFLARHY